MPSLNIIIGTDRLSVGTPGTGWKNVGVDPLVVDIYQLVKQDTGVVAWNFSHWKLAGLALNECDCAILETVYCLCEVT